MNRIIAILSFGILSACGQSNQPHAEKAVDTPIIDTQTLTEPSLPDTNAADPIDPIGKIRQQVERVNTSKVKTKRFEFRCDEKMVVDYFYLDGEIVKITVDFGTVGDVYAREAYYYDSGKLVFNYEFVEGGPACEGCIKTDEYRSYIDDNKVIKYLKNETEERCRTCEFLPSSRQYKLLAATTSDEMKKIICRL